MPKFNLATIERWEHRVTYNGVEAATLEDALSRIKAGDLAYDDQEVIECGDEVLCIAAADSDGEELKVPPEIGLESLHQANDGVGPTMEANQGQPELFGRELAAVLAGLRLWQRTEVTDADLLSIASEGRDDFCCGLTVEEIDSLCERLNGTRDRDENTNRHLVTLSNGNRIVIEEGTLCLTVGSLPEGEQDEDWLCQITPNGTLVYPNSGEAGEALTLGLNYKMPPASHDE